MSRGIYSLNKWQGIENHYAAWNIRENKSSATKCLETLKEFVLEDSIPLLIFGIENNYIWWLRNGGEAHICDMSLEIATPECKNHYEVTKYDMAADIIAYISSRLASRNTGNDIRVYKRTYEFDDLGKDNVSRGCHESYNSSIPYVNLEKSILPFLVIRPIFSGTGGYIKIRDETRFLISPRIFRKDEIMRGRSTDPLSNRGERIHFIFGECQLN
jgi:hypothetical protein